MAKSSVNNKYTFSSYSYIVCLLRQHNYPIIIDYASNNITNSTLPIINSDSIYNYVMSTSYLPILAPRG